MELRNGVTYGEDEIQWARNTSHHLKSDMVAIQDSHDASFLRFLNTVSKNL